MPTTASKPSDFARWPESRMEPKTKDMMQFHIRHLRAFLTILFMVFALRIASAQPLSVSPVSFDLGRFPAWKAQAQTFTIRNTGESTVNLLRVRSSCSCLSADFRPCALEAGQETSPRPSSWRATSGV